MEYDDDLAAFGTGSQADSLPSSVHSSGSNFQGDLMASPTRAGDSEANQASPARSFTSSIGSSAPDTAAHKGSQGSPVNEPGCSMSSVPAADVLARPRTRLQIGISMPILLTNGTIRYSLFCSTREPTCVQEAMGDERWKKAMDDEYLALIKNNT
ncbi:hypothetical protein E2562_036339 [Oryza meyeriana var. granulata]|uniref:Uncharacterized protein n=1 Tax=Oryza meyeriana var. granulata TaxID=110450 RepID=A0A6G1CCH4_9ORYZ|nr:hypothetical protein E2562_036339 [Oryza meyeriana var. granulata]